ncbi:hypothetical protein [Bacillus cereus]
MFFNLDEIMTTKEASDRWRITQIALRMKLKRSRGPLINHSYK